MQTVFIMRGCSASGKSTVAKMLKHGANRIIVSADYFFAREGAYRFDPTRLPEAHDWCFAQFCEYLRSGSDVIVDNTNTRLWEMQRYIDAAKACGANVQIIRMETPLQECLRRNNERTDRAPLKNDVITRQYLRMEAMMEESHAQHR